jgi:DNA ligase (NAD+)
MSKTSSIANKTFMFTGTLTSLTRAEAESIVKDNGGTILSGVTAKLNILVVGEDAGSKLEKAKKLGTVKILTEKEFMKMVPSKAARPQLRRRNRPRSRTRSSRLFG